MGHKGNMIEDEACTSGLFLGARIEMILAEGNEWEGEGRLLEGDMAADVGTRRDKYTNNPEVCLFFFSGEGFESVEV